jgi:hypothetical protein
MPHPEIAIIHDIKPHEAIATRAQILQKIVENKWSVAGVHIPFPGMGNLNIGNPGYDFTPFSDPTEPGKGTMPGWQIAIIVIGVCLLATVGILIVVRCCRKHSHGGSERLPAQKQSILGA